jgi:hypothetical protein
MHDVRVGMEVIEVNERMTYHFQEKRSQERSCFERGEPIGNNDGVSERTSVIVFILPSTSYLVNEMAL